MDHSGDGDFFYFLFCEMIECRDDSSCADHGYNSADSDSYRAAGIDEADRKGNDDGGEIKKIFSETHVLSAALAENSCQAVGRVWDDVDATSFFSLELDTVADFQQAIDKIPAHLL